MGWVMNDQSPRERRFGRPRFGSRRDHLLAEIDALAIELEEAGEATSSSRAPISARANYLRAREAHHLAAIAWMGATNPQRAHRGERSAAPVPHRARVLARGPAR